eukprot:NODE_284_length_3036_cov_151.039135_g246_i0.p1 GENE.NODE_284_length_3036_cov_151.039135_g246_i0~~NODE_284_length_3036_cov_151.039135_g246_i0.p1  ORF type:complete len:958 (+),score=270.19 NODE_284_length_3036_cov_151.039135_g246_i0:51-2924(+)
MSLVEELLRESQREWSEEDKSTLSRINVRLLSKVYDLKAKGLTPDEILGSLCELQNKKEGVVRQRAQSNKKAPTGGPTGASGMSYFKSLEKQNKALTEGAALEAKQRAEEKERKLAARAEARRKAIEEGREPPPEYDSEEDEEEEETTKGVRVARKGKKGGEGVLEEADTDRVGGGGSAGDDSAAGLVGEKTKVTESDLLAAKYKRERAAAGAGAEPEDDDEIPPELLAELDEEEEEEWLNEEMEKIIGEKLKEAEEMEEKGKDDPRRRMEEEQAWEDEAEAEAEAEILAAEAWEEEQRKAQEAAREGTQWDDDDGGPPSEDEDGLTAEERHALESELEREWEEEERRREAAEQEAEEIAMGKPIPHTMSLDEMDFPAWLKPHFTVLKYDPQATLGSKKKRIWVIDMCAKELSNLDVKGSSKKRHPSNKTLTLEKNVMNHNLMRVMFFDARHAYEMIFRDGTDRERFYECASAIRPNMRVWCPDLCKAGADHCQTTVKADGRQVEVEVLGKKEKTTVKGETTVNASRVATERIRVWAGTINLAGQKPPSFAEMEKWIPKDGYEIIAIAVQEAQYREKENDFYVYAQQYLGRPYVLLASMTLWDVLLCVFAKKRVLTKIANVEGHTKTTKHVGDVGARGGSAICLRYHETSLCFINLHLPEGATNNKGRQALWDDILDDLRLHVRHTDLTQQFHHTFVMGCLNYRVDMPYADAEKLAKDGKYDALLARDQLRAVMVKDGLFSRFVEHPINFPPTSHYKKGSLDLEEGKKKEAGAPSYTDRILYKNAGSAHDFVCTGYNACTDIRVSSHLPVSATFELDAQRPFISVFGHDEKPVTIRLGKIEIPENIGAICKSPLLMFWMHHVDGPRFSKPFKQKTNKPVYGASDLPVLPPMIWHLPFLATTHIFIMLRDGSPKSSELRGTALVPLRDAVGGGPYNFDVPLEFHSIRIGRMTGTIQVE